MSGGYEYSDSCFHYKIIRRRQLKSCVPKTKRSHPARCIGELARALPRSGAVQARLASLPASARFSRRACWRPLAPLGGLSSHPWKSEWKNRWNFFCADLEGILNQKAQEKNPPIFPRGFPRRFPRPFSEFSTWFSTVSSIRFPHSVLQAFRRVATWCFGNSFEGVGCFNSIRPNKTRI